MKTEYITTIEYTDDEQFDFVDSIFSMYMSYYETGDPDSDPDDFSGYLQDYVRSWMKEHLVRKVVKDGKVQT